MCPPAVFEMEFSHDQDQDPRGTHMERLMRLDSFLERPSDLKSEEVQILVSIIMVSVGNGLGAENRSWGGQGAGGH